MKRFVLGVVLCLSALTGAFQPVHALDTNDFTITSFHTEYYLDKDTDGRSTLKTVEKIVAVFPIYNQNHGLERAIPEMYDGHSTSLHVVSVSDENGRSLSYSGESSNDHLVLRIGSANTYVHGQQTYVITYTQRDVTRFFADTNDDEFYWDVNGTQWSQAMGEVSARLHVAPSLGDQINGTKSCYRGVEGSQRQCIIEHEAAASSEGTVFSANVGSLAAGENMTIAIGFLPQTFAPYQQTWAERLLTVLFIIWLVSLVLGLLVTLFLIIWMSIRYRRIIHRIKGRGTIIPEYLPPKDTSVLMSAQVLKNATSDMTAQLIDLAVRHYLKIYRTKEKTLWSGPEYELEIIKETGDLRPEERRLLENLFSGQSLKPGTRLNMNELKKSTSIPTKLLASRKKLQTAARQNEGLFVYAAAEAKQFRKIAIVSLIIGILTLSPLIFVAIFGFIFSYNLWPLTEKGVTLRDYLLGLRHYISVAEEERIKMLQSPEGAEKVGVSVDGSNPKELVKLYERVLPYAVLFGIEKEWSKQLGVYYDVTESQPDWYVGNGTFNAIAFSSAMSSITSQASSYTSSSSSSSGGSSGGGSSGGGGGGGGGGGW